MHGTTNDPAMHAVDTFAVMKSAGKTPVVIQPALPLAPVVLVLVVIFICTVWSQAAYVVVDPAQFVYFPPFEAGNNANATDHLGGEYLNIARSLTKGQGFSNPFHESTGPTAWMPPLLPMLYAGLLLGGKDAVIAAAVLMQVAALCLTAVLTLVLANEAAGRRGAWLAAILFLLAMAWDFHAWFQFTHDYGLILLVVDLLIVGLIFGRPFASYKAGAAWGLAGGFFALTSPIVGLAWLALSSVAALRRRAFAALFVSVLVGGAILVPWTIRNYAVLGRFIPIKSNASYELFQSQCLQADGLLQSTILETHPYATDGPERRDYVALGEMAFLDQRADRFWRSVKADPLDFCDRAAYRFFGVTLWYVPVHREDVSKKPWGTVLYRLLYPLPFLSLLVILFTAPWTPLSRAEWVVAGFYVLYLSPYIAISYYDRYGLPLLGIKTLLIVFAANRLRPGPAKQLPVGIPAFWRTRLHEH